MALTTPGRSQPSRKLAESAVPTAMSISVLRSVPGSNAAVFSAHRAEGDVTTSDLYLRIFGDDGYSVYWLTSGFAGWDVREASPDRILVALHGRGPSDDGGPERTLIVTFGEEDGHAGHGFYPTPEAVAVSLAQ